MPAVVTVHDLAVYAAPETFAWAQRWHLRLLLPRAVAAAARVITPSEHARADVLGRFRTAPERVAAIPLGVEAAFRAAPPPGAVEQLRALHGLGPRLVACVGTVQPRKHVERVIEAFVRAGAATRGWQLALAGRLRPGYAPPWLVTLPPGVHWLGPLPAHALRALYAAAGRGVTPVGPPGGSR